jgi:Flp pilus assembly protein TadG
MIKRLLKDRTGTAAAEMALVTPLLIILMFGSFELGKYFWDNHIVTKAVRDGARYASRQSFDNFDCTGDVINAAVVSSTQNLTRTSQIASGGSARLAAWTQASSVLVELRCEPIGDYAGFYTGMADIPVVTVTATVPYTSLFQTLGFDTTGINIVANSEAPVMGI